jgi:hypothetical protein
VIASGPIEQRISEAVCTITTITWRASRLEYHYALCRNNVSDNLDTGYCKQDQSKLKISYGAPSAGIVTKLPHTSQRNRTQARS